MPGTNHYDNFDLLFLLESAPIVRRGFSRVALLVAQASNSLNSERFIVYDNATDAADDNTAGYISAATLLAVQTAFTQRPPPEDFAVVRTNLAAAETYAQARAAALAAGVDAYGWTAATRTDTDIAALALVIEADTDYPGLYIFQSGDASWLDSGIPAGFSAMAEYESSAMIYHDTAAAWADVAWAANRLAFDPDEKSVPWVASLSNVDAYATPLSTTQKGFLKGQGNAGLIMGSAGFYVDPGKNMNGRPIDQIETRDWFQQRIQEDLAELVVQYASRGEKLPVTTAGQAAVKALVAARFQQGISAGHFTEYQITMPTITDDDRDSGTFRLTGYGVYAVNGRLFNFTFNFSTTPLASA